MQRDSLWQVDYLPLVRCISELLHSVRRLLSYVMQQRGSKTQANQGEIDLANGTAEERDRANSCFPVLIFSLLAPPF